MDHYGRGNERFNTYNGNQMDPRGYSPSPQVSYGNNGPSGASTPSYSVDYNMPPTGQHGRQPYPAWTTDIQTPLSKEEVKNIFLYLITKFGF